MKLSHFAIQKFERTVSILILFESAPHYFKMQKQLLQTIVSVDDKLDQCSDTFFIFFIYHILASICIHSTAQHSYIKLSFDDETLQFLVCQLFLQKMCFQALGV